MITVTTLHEILEKIKNNDLELTVINLTGQNLEPEVVTEVIEAMQHNKTVTELNLSGEKISEWGAYAIKKMLHSNFTLKSLNLTDCNISVKHTVIIAEGIERNFGLQRFYYAGNNLGNRTARMRMFLTAISDLPEEDFVRALQQYNTAEILNDIGEDEKNAFNVAINDTTILNRKKVIQESLNNISNYEVKTLAQALEKNPTITNIDLQNTNINLDNIKLFAALVQKNHNIMTFNLPQHDTNWYQLSLKMRSNMPLSLIETFDYIDEVYTNSYWQNYYKILAQCLDNRTKAENILKKAQNYMVSNDLKKKDMEVYLFSSIYSRASAIDAVQYEKKLVNPIDVYGLMHGLRVNISRKTRKMFSHETLNLFENVPRDVQNIMLPIENSKSHDRKSISKILTILLQQEISAHLEQLDKAYHALPLERQFRLNILEKELYITYQDQMSREEKSYRRFEALHRYMTSPKAQDQQRVVYFLMTAHKIMPKSDPIDIFEKMKEYIIHKNHPLKTSEDVQRRVDNIDKQVKMRLEKIGADKLHKILRLTVKVTIISFVSYFMLLTIHDTRQTLKKMVNKPASIREFLACIFKVTKPNSKDYLLAIPALALELFGFFAITAVRGQKIKCRRLATNIANLKTNNEKNSNNREKMEDTVSL